MIFGLTAKEIKIEDRNFKLYDEQLHLCFRCKKEVGMWTVVKIKNRYRMVCYDCRNRGDYTQPISLTFVNDKIVEGRNKCPNIKII